MVGINLSKCVGCVLLKLCMRIFDTVTQTS